MLPQRVKVVIVVAPRIMIMTIVELKRAPPGASLSADSAALDPFGGKGATARPRMTRARSTVPPM